MNLMEAEQRSLEESKRVFRRFFRLLLRYWWVLSGVIVLSLLAAFLYIRYTPSVYAVSAQIIIDEDSDQFDLSKLVFEKTSYGASKEIANELVILKSYSLVQRTVLDLGHNISYLRTTEALERVIGIEKNESPYLVKQVFPDSLENYQHLSSGGSIVISPEDDSFTLKDINGEIIGSGKWGDQIRLTSGLILIIRKNDVFDFQSLSDEIQYMFNVASIDDATRYYQAALQVEINGENSSAIKLGLSGPLVVRETEFLSKYLDNYLDANLREKNVGASNTIEFISSELEVIKDSLKGIETKLEVFKSNNRIGNLDNQAQRSFEQLLILENEKATYALIDKYLSSVERYLEDGNISGLIAPSSFGVEDPILNGLTDQLLMLEAKKDVISTNEKDGISDGIDARIASLRKRMRDYYENLNQNNRVKLESLNYRINLVESAIAQIPSSELTLMNIQRLQKLSESLYLLLMEKRAEAQIAKSSNKPDVRIVDGARITSYVPVSPKKDLIYIVALFFGLTVPTGGLFLLAYTDKTIQSKDEVLEHLDLPFLGYVPKVESYHHDLVTEKPKSSLSESLRTLRSNMKLLRIGKETETILITSCFPGEGKTFVSSNLAKSLGLANYKVLLIGADLRKPQLQSYFSLDMNKGLSSIISGGLDPEKFIVEAGKNVFVLPSGPIPPNPLEILESERFKTFLNEMKKQYEYVLIDTSPFALVSDAKSLFNQVDQNIIVLSSGISQRGNLKIIDDLTRTDGVSKNFCVVLNNYSFTQEYGYGRGYSNGYGYYES